MTPKRWDRVIHDVLSRARTWRRGTAPAECRAAQRSILGAHALVVDGMPGGRDDACVPRTVPPVLPPDALASRDQPILTTDGLVLRPWHEDDAPAVQEAFAAPDIQHWHLRRIDDLEEARKWLASWAQRWSGGTDASWAVSLPGSAGSSRGGGGSTPGGRAVGYVALRSLLLAEGSAEISYWIPPAARGRRLASRAAQAVSEWAFDDLGLHRVWLMHSVANLRSCAVAVGAGFPAEGTMREHLRHADGWHDMHLHGRLSCDRCRFRIP